jgi:hypothetical protein
VYLSRISAFVYQERSMAFPANALILRDEMENRYFTGPSRRATRNAAFLSLVMYNIYQNNVDEPSSET